MDIKEIIDKTFRGNIYIVQNGKVLCERASGFADLPNEIPNTLETKFASASAGKVFVAVGILQLIERERIKYEDTLGTQLPPKCADNYIYCADTDEYRTNIFSVDVKGTGAGGAFITVKDIVRFWTNLLEGKLISKELVWVNLCFGKQLRR